MSPLLRTRLVALAIALPPFLVLVVRFDSLCDDAFIVFRYGRNLAEGLGLRFNAGPHAPVEGYTQLLWVLWTSLLAKLGLDVPLLSRVSLVACGIALLSSVAGLVARRAPGRPEVAVLATLFLGALPPVAAWATGGMETLAFTLFLFLAYERLLGDAGRPRGVQAGLWLVLLGLTRTDGPFFTGLLLLAAALTWWRSRSAGLARAAVAAGALAAGGALAQLAFRLAYHGHWLPNTAYAKIVLSALSLERGFNYTVEFLLTYPVVAGVLAAGAWSLSRRRDEGLLHALLLAAGIGAYVTLVGGDHMAMRRFLVPMLPFAALVFAALASRGLAGSGERPAGRGGRRAAVVAAGLLCVAVNALPAFDRDVTPESWRKRFHYNWNIAYQSEWQQFVTLRDWSERWQTLGRALRLHTRPGESLVVGAAGGIGYYSNLYLYDRHGLMSEEVARREVAPKRRSAGHEKTVPIAFFLPRSPTYLRADLISLGDAAGRDARPTPSRFEGYEELVIPLDPKRGFGEGSGLLLVRRVGAS